MLLTTCTFTGPSPAAGLTAVIVPLALIVHDAAGSVPNRTPVAVGNCVPEMTTVVPPVIRPKVTLSPVTVGGGVR